MEQPYNRGEKQPLKLESMLEKKVDKEEYKFGMYEKTSKNESEMMLRSISIIHR